MQRLQYRMTRNDTWLRSSWPTIESCARFWAGKMTESQNRGKFTVVSDIGPDERAGIVSDDVYTNALAGETLACAYAQTCFRAVWPALCL
jgi:trehalose/maltose hydrolase-like predicted phosphorylase